MNDQPRRRGRPPASAAVMGSSAESAVAEPTKRRRRSSVGGYSLKLDAPQREGYVRRWFNDDKNRLAEAAELGYEPVLDQGIKSSSLGSNVTRLVGTKASGEPLNAVLMETPIELYQQGVDEKEDGNRLVDQAISDGRDMDGNSDLSQVKSSTSSIR